MPPIRFQFTVRWLMVVTAVTAFEVGLGSFLYREACRRVPADRVPWAETGVQVAFLNLLIGGPAWLLVRALEPEAPAGSGKRAAK